MNNVFAIFLAFSILASPLQAQTTAESEASAAFERFLVAMTDADTDTVVSLFAEDALFWGTRSKSLVTDAEGVLAYFEPFSRNEPGEDVFRSIHYETREISGNLAMISGLWEAVLAEQDNKVPLRVSMLLAKRDGEWQIIQFHNSAVPQ